MLRFTNSPEARAFEQLNEYVALKRNKGVLQAKLPGLKKPDPLETAVIQWYLDRQSRKKEGG